MALRRFMVFETGRKRKFKEMHLASSNKKEKVARLVRYSFEQESSQNTEMKKTHSQIRIRERIINREYI